MTTTSIIISIIALIISCFTAWANIFRRGTIRLTKPAFIAFCYDNIGKSVSEKIFIRALLYSTGKRGHVIENMFLIVRRGKQRQTFSVWGHGDEKLSRGSGLFVGETGIATNHHFNPAFNAPAFGFFPGKYEIQIFATLPGFKKAFCLSSVIVNVPESDKSCSLNPNTSIWFDWEPNNNCYHPHIETRLSPNPVSQ